MTLFVRFVAAVGGKPRRRKKRGDDIPFQPGKRGCGTKKTPVIGTVERGGTVMTRIATDMTGRGIIDFINKVIDPQGSILISLVWCSHHHYRKHYMLLYIVESCWKYNERKNDNAFGTFLKCCFV